MMPVSCSARMMGAARAFVIMKTAYIGRIKKRIMNDMWSDIVNDCSVGFCFGRNDNKESKKFERVNESGYSDGKRVENRLTKWTTPLRTLVMFLDYCILWLLVPSDIRPTWAEVAILGSPYSVAAELIDHWSSSSYRWGCPLSS
jgi:hypothetical protein